jgi:DNA-directed RNA polymerase specialized sigma subunit
MRNEECPDSAESGHSSFLIPHSAIGDDLEALVTALEKSRDLHRLAAQLAGRSREVFELLIRDERPVDIARRLGISKARVSQLMQILCGQLRTKLRAEGWECNETLGVPLNQPPGAALHE